MVTHFTKIRVRYPECDRMGFCYHGNYAQFFEIAREELMRDRGLTYKSIEEAGFMLPVIEMNTKFFQPAFYDDNLTIKLTIKEKPSIKIRFYFEVLRGESLLVSSQMILAFMSAETKKACRIPEFFEKVFEKDFS